jgi:hypothetical protein
MQKTKNIIGFRDRYIYLALGVFMITVFGYFCFIANYVLYFQETQSLFVYSADYLHKAMLKPGGLIEYAARFLSQFYHSKVIGSLILSAVITLPGLILHAVNKRLITGISSSLLLLLIPSFALLIMQANYFHLMEFNLGFVLILGYYLFSISSDKRIRQVIVVVLFPFVYFISGAYALIFMIMYIIHNVFQSKNKHGYIYSLILPAVAAFSFLVLWKSILLQPVELFILNPLPLLKESLYRATFIALGVYIISYPAITRIAIKVTGSRINKPLYTLLSIITVFGFTILILFKTYNPQTSRVVKLQRLIFDEKWKDAATEQEKKPARNLIGEYFYNIALSETDQLCDRLFSGSQDFGTNALVLPWGDEHLNRGAYFYYSIGLMNEAHRWAYEEMVVYGQRPQNIEMLAKTSLINGKYSMAEKYINILKRTIYYRKEAEGLEKLVENPELIKSDPELGPKLNLLPREDFFIQFNEPQTNLPIILASQPDNRKAFEYYMAGLLLTKNVETIVENIGKMKAAGFTRIPRHIEEAALIYYNSTKVMPDLGGLIINPETKLRFDHYFTSYVEARKKPSTLKDKMQKQFGDTFWYYFHFN